MITDVPTSSDKNERQEQNIQEELDEYTLKRLEWIEENTLNGRIHLRKANFRPENACETKLVVFLVRRHLHFITVHHVMPISALFLKHHHNMSHTVMIGT